MIKSSPNLFTNPHTYQKNYYCEYLVVGTGPGGSVAGELLSKNGKEVIFIEEGGFYPPQACSSNIGGMTAQLYRNSGVLPFLGQPSFAFAEGCCVGGGSVINGGLLWRTPPWILEEWQQKYGLQGYSEKDLAKHFERIESRLHVVKHTLETDANLDSAILAKGADKLGWKHVLVPRAVKNCINKNFCATGCPIGTKQSMLETYLLQALNHDAKLFSGLKATKILWKAKKATCVIAESVNTPNKELITFHFDKLILAGGAIQTPHLLRRSHCSKLGGKKLEFHINLKIVAKFPEPIESEKGTIFTVQVQEFEKEGTLFMASNMRPHYLAVTLAHFGNAIIDKALNEYPHYGIYATMIKPNSKARIVSILGKHPLIWYQFDPADVIIIKKALRQSAKLLFASGACELYMPIGGTQAFHSFDKFDKMLDNISAKHLEMISVHAMASCPMGDTHQSVVNQEGRLNGYDNIYITDASVLPSNIGESPQGTIMAFASEIMARHLKG
ncbi:MAG: hypothetical protein DRQ49_15845 [Gammaproteobacteria bacterium]|nr:MAG: hypothetical protein DRQ49_15845 [Gammaproteobacteria bacterium]